MDWCLIQPCPRTTSITALVGTGRFAKAERTRARNPKCYKLRADADRDRKAAWLPAGSAGKRIGYLRRLLGVSPPISSNLFWTPDTDEGLRGKTMAEIHDQFDTILILDFGSQVRSQLTCTGRPHEGFDSLIPNT